MHHRNGGGGGGGARSLTIKKWEMNCFSKLKSANVLNYDVLYGQVQVPVQKRAPVSKGFALYTQVERDIHVSDMPFHRNGEW